MEDRRTAGGIGFFGMLTILFIGLKLGGIISWSWLWVLSPIWPPITLVFLLVAICLVIDLIFGGNDEGGFNGRS